MFWLSLFGKTSLTTLQIEGYSIPTLVNSVIDAKELLTRRRAMLERVFLSNRVQLEDWIVLIENLSFEYIKVDTTEVWDLDPGSFGRLLPSSLRWFDSNAGEDFQQLQTLAEIIYDPQSKTINVEDSVKHNLHGYQWVRPVTWDDEAFSVSHSHTQPSFEKNEANWQETLSTLAKTFGLSDQTCNWPECSAKAMSDHQYCPNHEFASDTLCKWAGCDCKAIKNSVFCPGHSQ